MTCHGLADPMRVPQAIVLASALLLGCQSAMVADPPTAPVRAPASPDAPPALPSDSDRCERLRTFSKSAQPRLFAEIGVPDSDAEPEWREFDTNEAMSEVEHYTDASVWSSSDGWLVAMSLTSASGDWMHEVEYCFRPDGSIVQADSELRTMYAHPNPVARSRRTVFAADGHEISRTMKVVDQETQEVLADPSFQDQDEPLFESVRAVPFARLLSPSK
jgi:hypothetical protein